MALKLWIRRKRGNRTPICSGCGRSLDEAYEISEREVRDLPRLEFRTNVVAGVYRVCPGVLLGLRREDGRRHNCRVRPRHSVLRRFFCVVDDKNLD
jgi:hypothetical protein